VKPCINCDCTERVETNYGTIVCASCDLNPDIRSPSPNVPRPPKFKGKHRGVYPMAETVRTGPHSFRIVMGYKALAEQAERNSERG